MNSWKELAALMLGGMLLLTLGAARLQQGSTAWKSRICANHLKSLVQAAAHYQDDYDGAFQPVIIRTKPSWTYWYSLVVKYVKDPQIFYCPANPKAEKMQQLDEGAADLLPPVFDPLSVSYGMNFCLSSSGESKASENPGNIRQIADPSYTIYFGDSKGASLRPTKWCWMQDYEPVHEQAANFAFIDGHVAAMNQQNLGVLHAFGGWKKDEKRWSYWK